MQQELAAANLAPRLKAVTLLPQRGFPSRKIARGCKQRLGFAIRHRRPLADDADRDWGVLRLLSLPEPFKAPNNNLSAASQRHAMFQFEPIAMDMAPHRPSLLRTSSESELLPLPSSLPRPLRHFCLPSPKLKPMQSSQSVLTEEWRRQFHVQSLSSEILCTDC